MCRNLIQWLKWDKTPQLKKNNDSCTEAYVTVCTQISHHSRWFKVYIYIYIKSTDYCHYWFGKIRHTGSMDVDTFCHSVYKTTKFANK